MNLSRGDHGRRTRYSSRLRKLSPVKILLGEANEIQSNKQGAVILLVALFLPVAVLCIGMVTDVALVLTAKKCVQDACDLGTLAGCQELDWELLAEGIVMLEEGQAESTAVEIAQANLDDMSNLIQGLRLRARIVNHPDNEPRVALEASFMARTLFLKWLPGFETGVPIYIFSESSVVERTQW